ncbi:probable E3 ubiquitin-protein ligase RHB1A [Nymphaea colorata]|nr:probable E3 ubiquitin-protein ligase RHB1A [Nymphaea colorata]
MTMKVELTVGQMSAARSHCAGERETNRGRRERKRTRWGGWQRKPSFLASSEGLFFVETLRPNSPILPKTLPRSGVCFPALREKCPCAPVEQDPFSLRRRFSAVSTDALVDTHLEASESEIFQAPPPPSLRFPNTLQDDLHPSGNTVGRHMLEDQSGRDALTVADEDLKAEIKSLDQCFAESPKFSGEKNSKLNEPISVEKDEEDVCPTCLEEYDKENPKIITNCGHHFHLSCILEWMERSDNCAVCSQPMMFKEQANL